MHTPGGMSWQGLLWPPSLSFLFNQDIIIMNKLIMSPGPYLECHISEWCSCHQLCRPDTQELRLTFPSLHSPPRKTGLASACRVPALQVVRKVISWCLGHQKERGEGLNIQMDNETVCKSRTWTHKWQQPAQETNSFIDDTKPRKSDCCF